MNKRQCVAISSIVLLLAAIAAAVCLWPSKQDAAVANVLELQATAFKARGSDSPEETREAFEALRAAEESLSEQQRHEVRSAMRERMQQRMAEQVHAYHQLDDDAKLAFLDEHIDRMEARRRDRPEGGAREARNGSQRTNSTGDANRGERRGRGGGMGRPGGRRQRSQMTDEEREARKRSRLDNTTAQERAEFTAFFEALKERREQRKK